MFKQTSSTNEPLCSSKASKRNFCNASSVSKLIKPLNISKTVCSNNTIGFNVCQISSVSQLVKPSTLSKPVLSNVRNVYNVSSISQLVKISNVTKSVCSSNASNSVICNSTCKPVSNFVSICQSVKPARKLIDVSRKRTLRSSTYSITSDYKAFFLVIIFVRFRVSNRKRRKYLKLCYLAMFLIVIFF